MASGRSSGVVFGGHIPRADEIMRSAPLVWREPTLNSATADLPARVREALQTGRPGSITRLTPERLERFEIDAVNGTVTLRGMVQSETERLMIAQRVAGMEGVRAVNNQLRVLGPASTGAQGAAEGFPSPSVLGREN